MKKIILGFVILPLLGQVVFAQVQNVFLAPQMAATPALHNNWSYTSPTEAFQMMQQSMAPVQNAVNTYNQHQYEMNMQLQQAAIAAQQQQRQIQADVDAQQRQIEAEKAISTMNEKENQELHNRAMAKLAEKSDAIAAQLKQVDASSQSKIKSGIEAIENP
jgi:hypothetical protein